MDKLKVEEYSDKLWQIHIEVSGFYNEYAKSVGLTLTALKVLGFIYRSGNCTQKDIVQLTYLPKQTVNAIIKGFFEKGYIKEPIESNSDKRNKVISFTEEGKNYAEQIISKAKEYEYSALKSMGEEKVKDLFELMTMYKNNLKIE
ncbi:MAG: winged helix-turn-helix transcriptional regulator [Candidatus Gastranaerophilales bacterium]|nr:winged helix-turn-helix transcriptional regulator [Candidatus Gastranaerophilales bacterium]